MSGTRVDLQNEIATLLQLHANVRRAHFETDVDLLVASDAEEWLYVRDSKITRQRREDVARFFSEYFEGATYSEWDDIEPPIVSVSSDGTMAWMIIHVKVRHTKAGRELSFIYAGIETYEKHDGRWQKRAEVGTFGV